MPLSHSDRISEKADNIAATVLDFSRGKLSPISDRILYRSEDGDLIDITIESRDAWERYKSFGKLFIG